MRQLFSVHYFIAHVSEEMYIMKQINLKNYFLCYFHYFFHLRPNLYISVVFLFWFVCFSDFLSNIPFFLGLVSSSDEDDSGTALLLLLVLWGPHSTHNGHRHVELTLWSQKNFVFILTLPILCLFSHHSSLVAVLTSAVFCSDRLKICACLLVWRKSQSWIASLLLFLFSNFIRLLFSACYY